MIWLSTISHFGSDESEREIEIERKGANECVCIFNGPSTIPPTELPTDEKGNVFFFIVGKMTEM